MAGCSPGSMFKCLLKGLTNLSYVHKCMLADSAEGGADMQLLPDCTPVSPKSVSELCGLATSGKLPAVKTMS